MRRQHHAAVTPSRGGRQNDLLGLSEFCRRHVRDPPGFAARAAATTAAPLRRQRRRGRIPEKPSPRATTLPLRSRQNASPFCDHLLPRFAPVECENTGQGSRHSVHNRLVGGLSPPSPTMESHANRDFPWFDEYPRFCRGAEPACCLCREEGPLQRQFGAFCLWQSKNRFPGAWEGAVRDSVRMRQRPNKPADRPSSPSPIRSAIPVPIPRQMSSAIPVPIGWVRPATIIATVTAPIAIVTEGAYPFLLGSTMSDRNRSARHARQHTGLRAVGARRGDAAPRLHARRGGKIAAATTCGSFVLLI